jgi:hypothetical protein
MPYLAASPVDFWRRWHISLSTWLRDYIYQALPADRAKRWHRYRNAAATFLLSGLWHGPSWTFVCWGAVHGLAFAADHSWNVRRQRAPYRSIGVRFIGWLATYLFVCTAWVLFRAQSFAAALDVLRKMSGLAPGGITWLYTPFLFVLPIIIAAHIIGVKANRGYLLTAWRIRILRPAWLVSLQENMRAFAAVRSNQQSPVYVVTRPTFLGAFVLTSWILALLLFGATGANPFIYFQF